jgi:hypothetical protein
MVGLRTRSDYRRRAQPVIERMRQDAEASHVFRKPNRGGQGKPHERTRITKTMVALIDTELTEQDRRQWIGLVAL